MVCELVAQNALARGVTILCSEKHPAKSASHKVMGLPR